MLYQLCYDRRDGVFPLIGTRLQTALIGIHGAVRRSGALDSGPGAAAFRFLYFAYKRFEDHLEPLLRRYPELVRGGNVLDVGANIGYTAAILARFTDPGSLVYAFEPEPGNFRMLQQSAGRKEFGGRIVAYQQAVGENAGTIQLWLNAQHHADHRVITGHFRQANPSLPEITVPAVSIDEFVASRPGPVSFVKIDVQGFEPQVCKGMRKTMRENPDMSIVLEYSPGAMRELGFDPSEVLTILTEQGLDCYALGPRGRLSPAHTDVLPEDGYVDLLFTHRNVNN